MPFFSCFTAGVLGHPGGRLIQFYIRIDSDVFFFFFEELLLVNFPLQMSVNPL